MPFFKWPFKTLKEQKTKKIVLKSFSRLQDLEKELKDGQIHILIKEYVKREVINSTEESRESLQKWWLSEKHIQQTQKESRYFIGTTPQTRDPHTRTAEEPVNARTE